MATIDYMLGRRKFSRPQAVLWSKNSGTLQKEFEGTTDERLFYLPTGFEVGADTGEETNPDIINQFIILSDQSRGPIQISRQRIESRMRMIDGTMRSHHIADKSSISLSWSMLPSRSYFMFPQFDEFGNALSANISGRPQGRDEEYTVDGGAGAAEMLDWYNENTGPFWVFLAYDNYPAFGTSPGKMGQLQRYNDVLEMYITDFNYSIVSRGASNYDFWEISVTLEEV